MISTRSLPFLILALEIAQAQLKLPFSVTPASVADLHAHALGAWKTSAAEKKQALRRGRDLQTYSDWCGIVLGSFEQSGYSCECGSNAMTCQLPSTCDTVGTCATVDLTLAFTDQLTMESVNVCIKYTSDPTGTLRDLCVSYSYGSDASTIESCSVQLEDGSGALTACSRCEPCDSFGASISVDCSNIIPDAVADCAAMNPTDGKVEPLFGGLGGNSTAGGGATPGNSGGGGNGNGGTNDRPSASSAVLHGSRGLVTLAGLALALMM